MASAGVVKMQVEEQIRAAFRERGWRVFGPEQFRGIAGDREILRALYGLVSDEKLTGIVQLRCSEGHDYKTISLEQFDRTARHPECSYCEEPDDDEPRFVFTFTLAPEFERVLLREGPEKKAPAW